jgi:hypothetical protein
MQIRPPMPLFVVNSVGLKQKGIFLLKQEERRPTIPNNKEIQLWLKIDLCGNLL